MKQDPLPENITIPLSDLLYILIGDEVSGSPCQELPRTTAVLLSLILKNSLVYKVDLEEVGHPRIWWFKDWKESRERLRKQREYSEKIREEHWIKEENVRIISSTILSKVFIPEDHAKILAHRMLNNPDCDMIVRVVWGIEKLCKNVEEIK